MFLDSIQGIIDRRILLIYCIDPDILSQRLPRTFVPKLYQVIPKGSFELDGALLMRGIEHE